MTEMMAQWLIDHLVTTIYVAGCTAAAVVVHVMA